MCSLLLPIQPACSLVAAYGGERYGPTSPVPRTSVQTSEFFSGEEMNTASTWSGKYIPMTLLDLAFQEK